MKNQKSKIAELEKCLQDNPDHPNRVEIETDLRNLRQQLEHEDYE